jgi:hypothetical protein
MPDKLYFGNIVIGEITCTDANFPSSNGTFRLTLPFDLHLFMIISKFIDHSYRLNDFYENAKESDDRVEMENEFAAAENNFLDLINSDQWSILEEAGERIGILVPSFWRPDGITWRLNAIS